MAITIKLSEEVAAKLGLTSTNAVEKLAELSATAEARDKEITSLKADEAGAVQLMAAMEDRLGALESKPVPTAVLSADQVAQISASATESAAKAVSSAISKAGTTSSTETPQADPTNPASNPDKPAQPVTFDTVVSNLMAKGTSRSEAITTVVHKHPKLYAAWRGGLDENASANLEILTEEVA